MIPEVRSFCRWQSSSKNRIRSKWLEHYLDAVRRDLISDMYYGNRFDLLINSYATAFLIPVMKDWVRSVGGDPHNWRKVITDDALNFMINRLIEYARNHFQSDLT